MIVDEASQVDLATGALVLSCTKHVAVNHLIRDYGLLTEEAVCARNPSTCVDFLLFRRVDKASVLAVEADGAAFHAAGSLQARRNEEKFFERDGTLAAPSDR